MFGNNPKRKPVKGDGHLLQVQEIFPTIQGEGPFTGRPAIFIRLGGCNLACNFCDTEFESFEHMALDQIIQHVNTIKNKETLAVITGGEPMRQNITLLCQQLIDHNMDVQIETNGTLYQPLPDTVSIVCSPKTTTGTYSLLRNDLLANCQALKFIISSSHPHYQNVGNVGQDNYPNIEIYVQPMDEYDPQKNQENLIYATKLAQQHNYKLSLQTHKILGIK